MGSSLPVGKLHLNIFCIDVFQAYKQFGRKILVQNSEGLAEIIMFRLEIEVYLTKTELTIECPPMLKVFSKKNGAFMTFNQFRQKIWN